MEISIWSAACALFVSLIWTFASARYFSLSKQHGAYSVNLTRVLFGVCAFPLITSVQIFWQNNWDWVATNVTTQTVLWLTFSLLGILGMADYLFLVAAQKIGMTVTVTISSIYPIWSAIFGWLLLNQSLSRLQVVGLVLTVVGLLCLVERRQLMSEVHELKQKRRREFINGVLLALLTSIFWAIGNYFLARGAGELPLAAANSIRFISAFMILPFFCLILNRQVAFKILPRQVIIRAAPLIMLEVVAGEFAYLFAFTHGPLAIGATLTSLSPLFILLLAWLSRAESVRVNKIIAAGFTTAGAALIIAG